MLQTERPHRARGRPRRAPRRPTCMPRHSTFERYIAHLANSSCDPAPFAAPHLAGSDTASHGSNRACAEMALEGVPECCSGARARRERRRSWYGGGSTPLGACHAKATASASHVGAPNERDPTAGSDTASHGSCRTVDFSDVRPISSGACAHARFG